MFLNIVWIFSLQNNIDINAENVKGFFSKFDNHYTGKRLRGKGRGKGRGDIRDFGFRPPAQKLPEISIGTPSIGGQALRFVGRAVILDSVTTKYKTRIGTNPPNYQLAQQ